MQHGVDGVIVPMENAACAAALADFVVDKELQQEIVSYLAEHDYGNEDEVKKIYEFLR